MVITFVIARIEMEYFRIYHIDEIVIEIDNVHIPFCSIKNLSKEDMFQKMRIYQTFS